MAGLRVRECLGRVGEADGGGQGGPFEGSVAADVGLDKRRAEKAPARAGVSAVIVAEDRKCMEEQKGNECEELSHRD